MSIKVLVKPEKVILEKEVEGYCESGYSTDIGRTRCTGGYECGWISQSSIVNDEEDILF